MRYFFLIAAITVFGCNSNQGDKKQDEADNNMNKCFVYPTEIDSLQVKDLYDSARWYVYAWHCNERYLSKRDTSENMTFGELPLKFNNLSFRKDTLEINFDFIDEYEHYPILPSMTRDNKQFLSGVGFDMKTRKRVYMLSPSGFSTVEKGNTTRYENPLQPEIVAYIKNNWNKLDSCFKELARKKGMAK